MMSDCAEPVHPGKILSEELKAIGINAYDLARRISVPDNRIYHIVHGRRSVTADTALRLGKFFNTTGEYWLVLQARYDLYKVSQKADESLEAIQPYAPPEAVQSAMRL